MRNEDLAEDLSLPLKSFSDVNTGKVLALNFALLLQQCFQSNTWDKGICLLNGLLGQKYFPPYLCRFSIKVSKTELIIELHFSAVEYLVLEWWHRIKKYSLEIGFSIWKWLAMRRVKGCWEGRKDAGSWASVSWQFSLVHGHKINILFSILCFQDYKTLNRRTLIRRRIWAAKVSVFNDSISHDLLWITPTWLEGSMHRTAHQHAHGSRPLMTFVSAELYFCCL